MSKIEWTEKTWNPITGCTKISPGCKNCWAERMARRLAGRYGYPKAPRHFDVTLHPDRLDDIAKRKKPTTYFVVSMGDLFHEDVPTHYIGAVFELMRYAVQHTFQILTKRPTRMLELVSGRGPLFREVNLPWPLPNVWLGITAENQATADERIPLLLQTPAALRFVSCEPLLGPVDLHQYLGLYQEAYIVTDWVDIGAGPVPVDRLGLPGYRRHDGCGLDWVIVGGESGPGARPMHRAWAQDLVRQCKTADVPVFVKQMGTWAARVSRYRNRKGADPSEWPADLQVREFPT